MESGCYTLFTSVLNRIAKIELHQTRAFVLKMFYEFLSLPGFVRLMSKVVKNIEEHVSENGVQEI